LMVLEMFFDLLVLGPNPFDGPNRRLTALSECAKKRNFQPSTICRSIVFRRIIWP
jgi:hypothetical protein